MRSSAEYNDIFEKFKFTSTGTITKTPKGKYSFKVELHIMPMDDILVAHGGEFDSAMKALEKLCSTYGQNINDLLEEHRK